MLENQLKILKIQSLTGISINEMCVKIFLNFCFRSQFTKEMPIAGRVLMEHSYPWWFTNSHSWRPHWTILSHNKTPRNRLVRSFSVTHRTNERASERERACVWTRCWCHVFYFVWVLAQRSITFQYLWHCIYRCSGWWINKFLLKWKTIRFIHTHTEGEG